MLVLVKNIRKKLLFLWVGFSVPILLLVILQTITGKFDSVLGIAWVGVNLLPVLMLLFIGAMQNKQGNKVIFRYIFWIILVFSIMYLSLLLLTQFGLSARPIGQTVNSYFLQSYKWLVPFQIFLLLVFSALFYRRQALFQPNEKIIKNHLKEKAKAAHNQNKTFQEEAFDKLSESDFENLFEQLKQHTKDVINDSEKFNDTILLQSRYSEWKKKTEMDLINTREAQIILNQISMALVNLIDEL